VTCSQATKQLYDNKEELLSLWCHEICRVIGDRMWDAGDRTWLAKQMDERLSSTFSSSMATLFEATNNEVRPWHVRWVAGLLICLWVL
jgi:hypothetical protein